MPWCRCEGQKKLAVFKAATLNKLNSVYVWMCRGVWCKNSNYRRRGTELEREIGMGGHSKS